MINFLGAPSPPILPTGIRTKKHEEGSAATVAFVEVVSPAARAEEEKPSQFIQGDKKLTVLEAHQVFMERHARYTIGAVHYIESVEMKSLLCVDTENKRFVHITENQAGTEKPKYVPFSDITGIDYFMERPESHPIVTKPNQLLITSTKKKHILIDTAHYDYRKLLQNVEGLVKMEPEEVTDADK